MLTERSDKELTAALLTVLNQGPDIVGILLKTPVGPTIAINLLILATGSTWCDTPFVDSTSKACMELVARGG